MKYCVRVVLVLAAHLIGEVLYLEKKTMWICQGRWHLQAPQYTQKHYMKWQNKN